MYYLWDFRVKKKQIQLVQILMIFVIFSEKDGQLNR